MTEIDDLRAKAAQLGLSLVAQNCPTFGEYMSRIRSTATALEYETHASYWNAIVRYWAHRQLDDPDQQDVKNLMDIHARNATVRSNWRGGVYAKRNLLYALRYVYRIAELDNDVTLTSNPATATRMPRKLKSPRHALTAGQIAELGRIACETGNDPELDALVLRLHIETACRREAALCLSRDRLSEDDSTVLLHLKGGGQSWHPITPMLMDRLLEHVDRRGGTRAPARNQVFRTRNGRPITDRRYDNLHQRFHEHLPWAAAKGVTVHWIRHTTLTFVERRFGEAVARRYAAHTDPASADHDSRADSAITIYTKATLTECATALVAVTGHEHPLAPASHHPSHRGSTDSTERVW